MNTHYDIQFHCPARGLLSVPPHITVSETGPLTKTRPAHHLAGVHKRDAPYAARRGPRRRAQTCRSLFIAPCALREAYRKWRVLARLGWVGEIAGFGRVRHGQPTNSPPSVNMTCVADLATAFMDNQS